LCGYCHDRGLSYDRIDTCHSRQDCSLDLRFGRILGQGINGCFDDRFKLFDLLGGRHRRLISLRDGRSGREQAGGSKARYGQDFQLDRHSYPLS
jgi:hypothetical protein